MPTHSIEMAIELTGLSGNTILEYTRLGLVIPATRRKGEPDQFDDEALRTLRRIEHLRTNYGMNLPSLRLILQLLAERERLEEAVRRLRSSI